MNVIKLFLRYLGSHIKMVAVSSVVVFIFSVIFYLNHVPISVIEYALFLSLIFVILYICYDFYKFYKKHELLQDMQYGITINEERMPETTSLIERDYQDMIKLLCEDRLEQVSNASLKHSEMMDYYTLWTHQIKTPIQAMRLLLQLEHSKQNADLLAELFKVEQYVEMGLTYQKIDIITTDLALKKCDLTDIIKQAIRKYANVFIRKNITLEFKEPQKKVLTDEKWLVFVIEQLLSNALKYTNQGTISIYAQGDVLVIQDTGIGIHTEDLPRIFERGFTGYNGRMDKKATGIGLYLCHRILTKLSHKITIDSNVSIGTTVKLDLSSKHIEIE
ncbi:MAG: sensor histidine kinase [Oscillospiraceae bacterium]